MLFNSLTYLIFLLIVVILYWLLPLRSRLYLIFFSSLVFYGFWRIEFIALLLLSTFVDWFVSIKIYKSAQKNKSKLLILGVSFNIALLFYFKYLIFFTSNLIGFANFFGLHIDQFVTNIILPLGISFYTFQTISYTVDVYRGHQKPEKDFITYACYVTFFPQLVAGPILRASEVIPQFKIRPKLNYEIISNGLRLIFCGLFLKVVLADNISTMVDEGFLAPAYLMSAWDVWTLSFLFGFQIYFDFSAYSHIAIGTASLMGLNFPKNFNFPYLSTSPREFWKRWHISLSSWIRDYVYLPLAGAKVINSSEGGMPVSLTEKKKIKSLFLTWGIMGFWHGANWTFFLWGIYHAIIIASYKFMKNYIKIKNKLFASLFGFILTLPLMMLSWIPFRAASLEDTFVMWLHIINPYSYNSFGMRENVYLITFLLLVGIVINFIYFDKILPILRKSKVIYFSLHLTFFSFLTALVFIFLRPVNQFIYFQF